MIISLHRGCWTLWQSEVAKDYIFKSNDALNPLMDEFLRYLLIIVTGERILKYFGSPVKLNGQPHPKLNPLILSHATGCVYVIETVKTA